MSRTEKEWPLYADELLMSVADEGLAKARAASTPEEMLRIIEENFAAQDKLDAELTAVQGEKQGFESLTTNTSGGRPAEWFLQSGKYFSLGYATSCIAVGLVHENIGIAGSHINTQTPQDVLEDILAEKAAGRRLVIPSISGREQRLERIVREATGKAVEQFAGLTADGVIPDGTQLFTYGVTTQPSHALVRMGFVVIQTLESNPIISENPGDLSFKTDLGRNGKTVYGGKHHPKYSKPIFLPYK